MPMCMLMLLLSLVFCAMRKKSTSLLMVMLMLNKFSIPLISMFLLSAYVITAALVLPVNELLTVGFCLTQPKLLLKLLMQ